MSVLLQWRKFSIYGQLSAALSKSNAKELVVVRATNSRFVGSGTNMVPQTEDLIHSQQDWAVAISLQMH
jgi:hypothetical protein